MFQHRHSISPGPVCQKGMAIHGLSTGLPVCLLGLSENAEEHSLGCRRVTPPSKNPWLHSLGSGQIPEMMPMQGLASRPPVPSPCGPVMEVYDMEPYRRSQY